MTTLPKPCVANILTTSILLVCAAGCPASGAQKPDGSSKSEQKLAAPDGKKLAEAEERVKTLFEKDYAKADTHARKAMLAGRLLKIGLETDDDPVAAYVS
jgi:hypothetical protein